MTGSDATDSNVPPNPRIKPPPRIASLPPQRPAPKAPATVRPAPAPAGLTGRPKAAPPLPSATPTRPKAAPPPASAAAPSPKNTPSRAKHAQAIADKYRSGRRPKPNRPGTSQNPASTNFMPLIIGLVILGVVIVIAIVWVIAAAGIKRAEAEAARNRARQIYEATRLLDEQKNDQNQSVKKSEIEAFMADLKAQADTQIAAGRPMAAISLYASNRGRLARATSAERERIVKELQTRFASQLSAPPPPKEEITVEIF